MSDASLRVSMVCGLEIFWWEYVVFACGLITVFCVGWYCGHMRPGTDSQQIMCFNFVMKQIRFVTLSVGDWHSLINLFINRGFSGRIAACACVGHDNENARQHAYINQHRHYAVGSCGREGENGTGAAVHSVCVVCAGIVAMILSCAPPCILPPTMLHAYSLSCSCPHTYFIVCSQCYTETATSHTNKYGPTYCHTYLRAFALPNAVKLRSEIVKVCPYACFVWPTWM